MTVRIAVPVKTPEEIAEINRENDDCWESHLARATKRQETCRGW